MPIDLVTGASGFIGSHLVDHLLAQGRTVRALLRHSSSSQWLPSGIEVVRMGPWSAEELQPALAGIDRVYHVAGVTHADTREEFLRFHVASTQTLLDACCRAGGVSRVVVFSSLAAAGPSRTGQPRRECDAPAPASWYGQGKLAQEEVACSYADRLSVVVVRPPAVYGPRDRDFLPLFKLAARGFMPVPDKGTQSLTHVRDVVSGSLAAGSAQVASGSIYFISSREMVTWEGLAHVLGIELGRRIRLVRIPPQLLGAVGVVARVGQRVTGRRGPLDDNKITEARYPDWTCVPYKAERELSFSPSVELPEGVRETIAWYRDRGWL